MKFNVFTGMEYQANSASTLILSLAALRTPHQNIISEELTLSPLVNSEELTSGDNENRLLRMGVNEAANISIHYKALVDNCCEPVDFTYRSEMPVAQFGPEVLSYLYPSRYCQSD